MARPRNQLLDRIAYLPQRGLISVSAALPYGSRLAMGAAIGKTLATRYPEYRRRIDANLQYVMPELDAEGRAQVARDCGSNFGRTFIEFMNNRAFHEDGGWTAPSGDAAKALVELGRAGRGAVIVTGHFGQWEAGRAWLKSLGLNCAAVYRPMNNPHMNRIYLESLEFGGSPIFPKGRTGSRNLIRHLARGGMAAILTDQYDHRAQRLDFLGRPAPTSLAAAELALRYDLPLIPAYGVRSRDGAKVQVVVESEISRGSAEEMMQGVNDSLAAKIRQHPGQYYWFHRRWEKHMPVGTSG